jgi:signal transduction histidine kinase
MLNQLRHPGANQQSLATEPDSATQTGSQLPLRASQRPSLLGRLSAGSAGRWPVVLMLLSLHVALTLGLSTFAAQALLISHFGFFLLWQPVVRADRRVSPAVLLVVLLCGGALYFAASGWLIVLWLACLIGIIGGRVFNLQTPRLRVFYLLALAYLLMLLLIWAVPALLAGMPIPVAIDTTIHFGVPLLIGAMAVIPLERETPEAARVVDFFYSVLFFLLAVVLVLGSLALMAKTADYYLALTATIIGAGVMLLLLSAVWNPFGGFAGVQTFFSRYLLSVGLPFELWLRQLAEGAEKYEDPRDFLNFSVEQLARLPWVTGGTWHTPEGSGTFGIVSGAAASFESHDLNLTLYARIGLSPAILLHMRLLTQLLGEFYEAKRREQLLKQNAYMQAVHETGARLTHDIKNLLQSLFSLAAAGQNLDSADMDAYAKLVQRQLPILTKRLQLTLERLRAPAEQSVGMTITAAEWWESLQARYAGRDIEFVMRGPGDRSLPRNLFDSVAENLLDNARKKRHQQSGIKICAELDTTGDVELSVFDDGEKIPPEVTNDLFQRPVPSKSGMGIGLYQAYRQAKQAGFALALADEAQADGVRFTLKRGISLAEPTY